MKANQYQQRSFDPKELLKQIGAPTFLAISGGRIELGRNSEGEIVELVLPCGKGYAVAITLGWSDLYIVRSRLRAQEPKNSR
jgi:hypothetical protein